MAITLSRLCDGCEAKYNMHLIAGKKGMENTVRWVHMVEDSEVPDFLHGNELVFTTGIGHISGADRLLTFVRNLKEHNAVGVVVNLGPYIRDIPDKVIGYCEQNDFPLFTLPWKVHIIDITFDFCTRIIENEKTEVSLAEAFRSLITDKSTLGENIGVFERAGFNLSRPFRVIACKLSQNGIYATERIEQNNRIKLWRILTQSDSAATMFIHGGILTVIRQNCSEVQIEDVRMQLKRSCEKANIGFVLGVSDEDYGYATVATLFCEAAAALRTGECDGSELVMYRNIGVDKLLCAIDDKRIIDSYIDGVLGKITRYDELNHTEYLQLLRLYLKNGCSVMAVSDEMGVHRNTVNYQIRQIKKIFAIEFDEQTKMNLNLAFRILLLFKGEDQK